MIILKDIPKERLVAIIKVLASFPDIIVIDNKEDEISAIIDTKNELKLVKQIDFEDISVKYHDIVSSRSKKRKTRKGHNDRPYKFHS